MFDNLTRKLSLTFNRLAGRTELTEAMLDDALGEIKVALLEADVSLSVVKKIIANVREKAIGQKIVDKTTPAETVAKIVYDELVEILGGTEVGRLSMKDAGEFHRNSPHHSSEQKYIEFDAHLLLNLPDEIRFRALSKILGKNYPMRLCGIRNAFDKLDKGDSKFTLRNHNIRKLNGKIRIWKEGTTWPKRK